MLIRPITELLIGLAIAGWVSSSIAHGNNTAIQVTWILWSLLLLSFQRSAMSQLLGYGEFIVESPRQDQTP